MASCIKTRVTKKKTHAPFETCHHKTHGKYGTAVNCGAGENLRFQVFYSLMVPLRALGVVALLLFVFCLLLAQAVKLLIPGEAFSLV
jgi:hypothetical protein